MATVWTYGGYLCHVSKVTPSRKEGSLPTKLDKVGDVTTNQKFYEVNSRIVQLNEELRKTLDAEKKLYSQLKYYTSISDEKKETRRLAGKAVNSEDLTGDEVKKVSSMSSMQLEQARNSSGPLNAVDKVMRTMYDEYIRAYKKYQTISTLSKKLTAMEPVSKTAAASSYKIIKDIYDVAHEAVNYGYRNNDSNMDPLGSGFYTMRWANDLNGMPKPTPL